MTTNTLINAIIFQIVWLALVITASKPYFWAGPVCAIVALCLITPQIQSAKLVMSLSGVAFIGYSFDMLLHLTGIITIVDNALSFSWLLLLWLVFIAMFHQIFAWITRLNLMLVFSIGAIGGPLAYYSASLLNAVTINNMSYFLFLYGLFWGGGFAIASTIMIAMQLNESKSAKI